ncbi:MAG: SpoIIIAH-like family protein [Lachnospira sp.]|nr:SpoIIIAH-like family protein [Lachnospira sp.]
MIVALKSTSTNEQIAHLENWLKSRGLTVHISRGEYQTVLGLVGDTSKIDDDLLSGLDIVEKVTRISEPFKSANRKFHPDDTIVETCGVKIGGGNFAVMAGPCSVESREQLCNIAEDVKKSGASVLRGGAFKPRTSPYDFQGLKAEGIELLLEAKGFSDVVVSILDGNVDVVVNLAALTDTQKAQIEDIVKRKTGVTADKITINVCNNQQN